MKPSRESLTVSSSELNGLCRGVEVSVLLNDFKGLTINVRHNNADYCYRKKEEEAHSGDKAHT